MNDTAILNSATRTSALRYFSCLRLPDILVLQGPPLLGAVLAIRHPSVQDLGSLTTLMAANVFLVAHIFMLNDWAGLTADLADPNKAGGVFTTRGVGTREIAGLTAGLLVISLFLFSRLAPITLGLALSIAALSALYSLPIQLERQAAAQFRSPSRRRNPAFPSRLFAGKRPRPSRPGDRRVLCLDLCGRSPDAGDPRLSK